MDKKILIVSKKKTNIRDAIIYWLDQEKLGYEIVDSLKEKELADVGCIVYIKYDDIEESLLKNLKVPLIVISSSKILIDNNKNITNYIITPLTDDESKYTLAQKEYLYRKGIYGIITSKIAELIYDETDINGLIIDVSNCKSKFKDWVFSFNSISETYAWLSKKNVSDKNFTQKIVNFYHEKVYDDSAKEINYLTDRIKNIQDNYKSIDMFICTKEELQVFKTNYFFKLLLKNIRSNYHLYIVNRNDLTEKEMDIYNKFLDGVTIYEDCVYIDTYDDEYSLGKVDCKESTIEEYNKYYDYVIEKYGKRIYKGEDVNEL